MKKIIVSLLLVLVCSGCSVTYSVNLDEQVKENVSIENLNSNELEKAKESNYVNLPAKANQDFNIYEEGRQDGVDYYDYNLVGNDLEYNYTFARSEYNLSNILSMAYMHHNLVEDSSTIKLETGDECFIFDSFPDLDKVTVKITTDYDLLESNADKVDGNTYIWYLERTTWRDESIILAVSKNKSLFNNLPLTIFIFTVLVIGGIIYLVIRYKNNKNNSL